MDTEETPSNSLPTTLERLLQQRSQCRCTAGVKSSRNLVVCIDGTSGKFGTKNTHVVQLYSHLTQNDKQIATYFSGIGTFPRPSGWWARIVDRKLDAMLARSFEKNILAAYAWLSERYSEGDRIFLFGFSRGAFQARALCAMIHHVGLVKSGNEAQIPYAYELFVKIKPNDSNKRQKTVENFKRTFSRHIQVHFVGAWDTVSSINLLLTTRVINAIGEKEVCMIRHALALDERRVKFLPERYSSDQTKTDVIKEVWFVGAHSDIGGRNINMDDRAPSSTPLRWMAYEATSAGLVLKPFNKRNTKEREVLTVKKSEWWWNLLEYIPIKHQKEDGIATRLPHIGAGRIITPGQTVHCSVLTQLGDSYRPRATFMSQSTSQLSWDQLKDHRDRIEEDLYDLVDSWISTSRSNRAESEKETAQGYLRSAFKTAHGRRALQELREHDDRVVWDEIWNSLYPHPKEKPLVVVIVENENADILGALLEHASQWSGDNQIVTFTPRNLIPDSSKDASPNIPILRMTLQDSHMVFTPYDPLDPPTFNLADDPKTLSAESSFALPIDVDALHNLVPRLNFFLCFLRHKHGPNSSHYQDDIKVRFGDPKSTAVTKDIIAVPQDHTGPYIFHISNTSPKALYVAIVWFNYCTLRFGVIHQSRDNPLGSGEVIECYIAREIRGTCYLKIFVSSEHMDDLSVLVYTHARLDNQNLPNISANHTITFAVVPHAIASEALQESLTRPPLLPDYFPHNLPKFADCIKKKGGTEPSPSRGSGPSTTTWVSSPVSPQSATYAPPDEGSDDGSTAVLMYIETRGVGKMFKRVFDECKKAGKGANAIVAIVSSRSRKTGEEPPRESQSAGEHGRIANNEDPIDGGEDARVSTVPRGAHGQGEGLGGKLKLVTGNLRLGTR